MDMTEYSIQELSDLTGLPRRTIHFYSQQGLLPSPLGAGAGSHYTPAHLLRLQLIPLLRGQGLRLDEIRQRFQSLDEAALLEMHTSVKGTAAPRAAAVHPLPEKIYTHYALPAGLTLVAPSALSPADRLRLDELLQAARRIFSASPSHSMINANPSQEDT